MSDNVIKLFKSFIDDIISVFPEYKNRLEKYYKEAIESEEKKHPKIVEFLNNIEEISDQIIEKDIQLFNEDPVILQNVSFKLIWNSDISDQTKNSIWKYLQTFCIINIKSESSIEKINEVIKLLDSNEKVKDKETVKNMKKLKKLNENFDIQKIEEVIRENPESIGDGVDKMDSMFENTSIGKIAKEITQDLDIENIVSKDGGIEGLFSGGGMANIMQSISSKMTDKEGQMDTQKLMEEATAICGSMEGNPLFSSLMGMQSEMLKNLGEGGKPSPAPESSNTPEPGTRKITLDNPNHNPNVTRERLQRKLKEKKNMNIDKIE
tara:strand:- start:17 stop:982 length:966 start_codon:yes stop_codon:yes gene_type:complete